jgi:hypothetical protein
VHDEFRLCVRVPDPRALLQALKDAPLGERDHGELGRQAVTHEGDHVFLYADSLAAAQRAEALVRAAMTRHGLEGEVTLSRWHPVEERWEDAAAPLPGGEAERAAERARRDQTEDEESRAEGFPQWEVRLTLPTHRDARDFASRLRGEGVPVRQRWRHLFVGADDEDQAAALAERLRAEAPAGSEIVADGNGLLYWQELHPLAVFGGIAN